MGRSQKKKRKYDSEDSKRRLMQAGLDVFSKKGFDAATTREIAREAGVNLSLIPRYFENKLGLLFAISQQLHQKLANEVPYPESGTLQEELRQFFKFRLEFARKNRKLMRLAITRAILDPKAREQFSELVRFGIPWFTARLERLRSSGAIRKEMNSERASMLMASITFAMGMWSEIAFSLDPELVWSVLDQAVGTLSEGLVSK